jgi:hypothetical protein
LRKLHRSKVLQLRHLDCRVRPHHTTCWHVYCVYHNSTLAWSVFSIAFGKRKCITNRCFLPSPPPFHSLDVLGESFFQVIAPPHLLTSSLVSAHSTTPAQSEQNNRRPAPFNGCDGLSLSRKTRKISRWPSTQFACESWVEAPGNHFQNCLCIERDLSPG